MITEIEDQRKNDHRFFFFNIECTGNFLKICLNHTPKCRCLLRHFWCRCRFKVPVLKGAGCRCRFVVPGAGAGAGQSQPANKVPGAGAGLWCRVPVPVPVRVNRQIKCRVPGAGAGLWCRVPRHLYKYRSKMSKLQIYFLLESFYLKVSSDFHSIWYFIPEFRNSMIVKQLWLNLLKNHMKVLSDFGPIEISYLCLCL